MAVRMLFFRRRNLPHHLQSVHSVISGPHENITSNSYLPSHSHLVETNVGLGFLPIRKISSLIVRSEPSPLVHEVNEICRVLSDFRSPHHDIEPALEQFTEKISTDLVEQVLKRCRNLGVSAHRFFLWARKLPSFSHSRESYHILVDILGSTKQFPLIWDFLLEMRDGNHEIRPEIFWVIFRAYCKANLPADAIRAFEKMNDFGLKPGPDDLNQLLGNLCEYNLVSYAQHFFEENKFEFSMGPKTYSILMKGWGDSGNSAEAVKVFDKMLQRGCDVDVVAYNTLLRCLCQDGKMDEAYKLFREMRSKGLEPNACSYAAFIRAACEANDAHSALRVLDRMRRYELVPNTYTYNCIIKMLCKNRRVDDAYQLLDEMIERGATPDIWSYNTILAVHCELREVNKALRLFRRIHKDSCSPDRHTYNMVLKMLIGVGRFDRVVEVWDGMGERGFYASVSTYAVMVHGLCKKKGRLEDACRYFEMMIDEGIPPYQSTCELLRDCLSRLGLWETTNILANKMRRSTSCSIQELSDTMEGDKEKGRLGPRREDQTSNRKVRRGKLSGL